MSEKVLSYSVFTKPWKTQTTQELCRIVNELGFNGIELPLRDGYQVDPQNAKKELPAFVKKLSEYGLKITSVASTTEEHIFDACHDAGIDLMRIMFGADLKEGYMKSEYKMKKQIESFLPLCEKYNVRVGVQHHYGPMVSNSMELRHLLEGFNPKYVGAVWDSAHSGLAGEEPEQGLDIIWDYLILINLKNAFYLSKNGPETDKSEFERYFTTGKYGNCDWERVIKFLSENQYKGTICLPAEYTDEAGVYNYVKKDLEYVKSLATKYYTDK